MKMPLTAAQKLRDYQRAIRQACDGKRVSHAIHLPRKRGYVTVRYV